MTALYIGLVIGAALGWPAFLFHRVFHNSYAKRLEVGERVALAAANMEVETLLREQLTAGAKSLRRTTVFLALTKGTTEFLKQLTEWADTLQRRDDQVKFTIGLLMQNIDAPSEELQEQVDKAVMYLGINKRCVIRAIADRELAEVTADMHKEATA